MFRALVLNKDDNQVRAGVEELDEARLPAGDVTVAVEYSTLNYKDGLIIANQAPLVRDYPHVNASVDGESLVVHRDVNLAIAVDLEFKGLVAPVIRNADGKRLRQLAREIRDLAGRAKSKQLGPDDIQGGTFTITNMGPFGTTQTFPIINQPQVAIMGIGAIGKRPVVVEDADGCDTIAIRVMSYFGITYDHRLVDGADADHFMNSVKKLIESDAWPELEPYY